MYIYQGQERTTNRNSVNDKLISDDETRSNEIKRDDKLRRRHRSAPRRWPDVPRSVRLPAHFVRLARQQLEVLPVHRDGLRSWEARPENGRRVHTSRRRRRRQTGIGVARFIDASIYRDTFPAISIAILFFTITIFFSFQILFHNDFHLGRKET